MIIVICFIICLYTLDTYIAINMDPVQTTVEVDDSSDQILDYKISRQQKSQVKIPRMQSFEKSWFLPD